MRTFAALLVAGLLSACGSSTGAAMPTATASAPSTPTASPSSSVALAPGWTTTNKTSSAGPLHVALPPTWRTIDLDAASIAGSYAAFASANPDFGKAFTLDQMKAFASSGITLYAFDFDPASSASGFLTNMNTATLPTTAGLSAATYAQVTGAQLEVALKAKTVSSDKVSIADYDAMRSVYEYTLVLPTTSFVAVVVQYYIVANGFVHVMTFTTQKTRYDTYRDTFERIAQTYRVG